MNINEEKRLEKLGAFEVSAKMLKLAKKNDKGNVFLNAGRGNPNWINTKARLAFNRIVEFGIQESEQTFSDIDLAGYTVENNIKKRFENFLNSKDNEIDDFLLKIINYSKTEITSNEDAFIKELVDGALGNNYPVPSRVLKYTERILNKYLESALYNGNKLAEHTQLFPTEGGTAAIVYIFNSLKQNKLIKKGDKIAINTPIFTPYLQIPKLNEYKMTEINLQSKEENNWELLDEDIEKLIDPNLKALFLVNPSNPSSMSLSKQALEEIQKVIEKNPNLIIITDDVYGTFVKDFQSVYSVVPTNTILVYSYSKLYGATGWRLGTIALHENNIVDKLITELPENEKKELDKRYGIDVFNPREMKFIDRMVADSRSIGLYHTSGLSTPQQIMESLFSLSHLITKRTSDPYVEASNTIVDNRYQSLFNTLNLPKNTSPNYAKYYSVIDLYKLSKERYGEDFEKYIISNFEQIDFLVQLAKKMVLLLWMVLDSKAAQEQFVFQKQL